MQFKKLAAIAGSALMAGLSIAGPALATSVTELGKISDMVTVTDSTVSFPIFVIGAKAATADVAGAVDVAVNLAANAKTTTSVTTTIAGESVTGGAKIATAGMFLTPYTNPQDVKGIMTVSDIPSLLASGTYSSAAGGTYNYKQYLYILGEDYQTSNYPSLVFERPTAENSPRVSFKTPSTSTSKIWTYKLTFSTPVSLSGVTDDTSLKNVIQGTTINMVGKDFVISDATWTGGNNPTAKISTITLLGGKNVVSVETGTPKTVSIDTKDYTITLTGVAAQTVGSATQYTAIGDVNGEIFQLKAGQTTTLADGTLIAAIRVFQGKTGAADFATLAIGADKITLSEAGTVTKGTEPKSELTASITSSQSAGWSVLSWYYIPSTTAWISAGEKMTDPLVSAFDIKFNSIIPDFTDTANRQVIKFDPFSFNMMLTYKNAADAEKQMYSLYTEDGTTWKWAQAPTTAPNYRDVIFDEGLNISAVDQDYFVIQKGGFSHTMQFISYTPTTYAYTFTDESGNTISATGSQNAPGDKADLIVDGNTYKIVLVDNSTKIVNIDLDGDGKVAGVPIASIASPWYGPLNMEYSFLVPKLITTGQGGLYFYDGSKTITADADGEMAGIGLIGLNVTTGKIYDIEGNEIGTVANDSGFHYTTASAYSGYLTFGTNCTAGWSCKIGLGSSSTGIMDARGFVLVQEAEQGGTDHNWLFIPVLWDDTNKRTHVSTTLYSSDSKYTDIGILGTATQYKGMSKYGTLTDHLAPNLGGGGTVNYPDVFTYGNLYVLSPTGVISSSGVGGQVTTEKVLPITADVVKLDTDSDISTAVKNNDVIIVGGPCINEYAAKVLDKTFPACGAASGIPENAALIKLVADKFATGKTALLIAGWEAIHTDLAARIVQTGFPGATSTQKAGSSITVTGTVASPSYS